ADGPARRRSADFGRARPPRRADVAVARRLDVALHRRGVAPQLSVRRVPWRARAGAGPRDARPDGGRPRARRRPRAVDPLERRPFDRHLRLEHPPRLVRLTVWTLSVAWPTETVQTVEALPRKRFLRR